MAGGGVPPTQPQAQPQLSRAMDALGLKMSLGYRVADKLIAAFTSLEATQTQALGLGTTANVAFANLTKSIDHVPGGMGLALEHAMSFTRAGMKTVNKSMLDMAAQAKLTGQDTQKLIKGLTSVYSILALSDKEMTSLGETLQQTSNDYQVTTTDLVGALEANSKILKDVAAVSPEASKQVRDVIIEMTGKLGVGQQDNIRAVMSVLTAPGGIKDLGAASRYFSADVVAAIEDNKLLTGDVAMKASHQMVAFIKSLDGMAGGKTAITTSILAAFGNLTKEQAHGFIALAEQEKAIEAGNELLQDKTNREFTNSITALKESVSSAFKIFMLPIVGFLGEIAGKFLEWVKNSPKFVSTLTFISKILAGYIVAMAVWKTGMMVGSVIRNMWLARIAMKPTGGALGLIQVGLAIAALAAGYATTNALMKKRDDREEREAEETDELERDDWTVAMRAVTEAQKEAMRQWARPWEIPVDREQIDLLEAIRDAQWAGVDVMDKRRKDPRIR